ncbi:hypothetical protein MHYP_G00184770 [Metynnis hypsauchen]
MRSEAWPIAMWPGRIKRLRLKAHGLILASKAQRGERKCGGIPVIGGHKSRRQVLSLRTVTEWELWTLLMLVEDTLHILQVRGLVHA